MLADPWTVIISAIAVLYVFFRRESTWRWALFLAVTAALALLIDADAIFHVTAGHEWTIFVFQSWIVRHATQYSFQDTSTFVSAANASSWFPAEPADREIFPFTPVMWDIFVVFPAIPLTTFCHCVCGSIALTSGFVQLAFLERIPPSVHRPLGWVYALSYTIVACTGAVLGAHDVGGQLAKYNFGGMAFFAIVPTWMAVRSAVVGDFRAHRAWMIRSYNHCFSVAVLLRFGFLWLVPLMAERLPEDVEAPYMVLVFLSWSLPILWSDIYLTLTPQVTWPGGSAPAPAPTKKQKRTKAA